MDKQFENVNISSSGNFVITVKGKVDKGLYEIFGGLSISYHTIDNNIISHLEGEVLDQAELIGILNTLYNMRFPIVNVSMHDVSKE
jgi:hypothetical protein